MKGRPPIDKEARRRDQRRRVLERGLIAGLELIDGIRQEMAQLDAADRAGLSLAASESVEELSTESTRTPHAAPQGGDTGAPGSTPTPKHASDHQT